MTRKTAGRIAALLLMVCGLVVLMYAKTNYEFLAAGVFVGYAGRAFWHPAGGKS